MPNAISRRLLLLAAVLPVLAAACGDGEYTPGPAKAGPPATTAEDLAARDLNDTSITSIDLSTSLEFDADRNEVQIFAMVKDQNGNEITNLNQYNFSVVINPKTAPRGIPPADTLFGSATSGDKVVALVIDSSGSMSGGTDTGQTRIDVAKEAATLFVDLMGSTDRTAIVDFDDTARIVQTLTGDKAALKTKIEQFTADGATNLGGALTTAVRAVGTRPGRRAVILLTDGDDTVDSVIGGPDVWRNDPTSSRYQGLTLAVDNRLVVYTVGLGDGLSDTGIADLQTFASETGGRFFPAPTAAALLAAFGQTIPSELNAQIPLETFLLSFQNPIPVVPGIGTDVPVGVTVKYQNAIRRHTSSFSGTYSVR